MTRPDKINYVQSVIAKEWLCSEDFFNKKENIFLEADKTFFEIITFGHNAVIRADKKIIDWCTNLFTNMPASEIMDGENLYLIEQKMREHNKKLGGQYISYLHLCPEVKVQKPDGFTFQLYEKENMSPLYNDYRFENALNHDAKGEVLAIVARQSSETASMVGVDDYNYGLWQIGIDTVDCYRGKGLAAYLVKEIAIESEKRNQIPYYATWGANVASMRTVIKAGFLPVWTSYFAEDLG